MTFARGQIPGGWFDTTYFLAHHDRSIAKWNMVDGKGHIIGDGVSYAEYDAHGRLTSMTGFFEPAPVRAQLGGIAHSLCDPSDRARDSRDLSYSPPPPARAPLPRASRNSARSDRRARTRCPRARTVNALREEDLGQWQIGLRRPKALAKKVNCPAVGTEIAS